MMKPKVPSTEPSTAPTRSSLQMTRPRSRTRTSPTARARVTVVAAWLPVLPPVPVSSGMKRARTTT